MLTQLLDGISTTTEVHFYNVPELDSLALGGRGENCTSKLVELKTSDPNFIGTFNLTFTLPGTLVPLLQYGDPCIINCIVCLTHAGFN